MASKSVVGDMVICIFAIIVIFVAFNTNAYKYEGRYNIYKAVLQWPISYCNRRYVRCEQPIIEYFTIHGLWPMYWNDKIVPPYGEVSGCTEIVPMKSFHIRRGLFLDILNDMMKYWPLVKYHHNLMANELFWKSQWEIHGMCFDKSDEPLYYFRTALNVPLRMNLLQILKEGGIVPSNSKKYSKVIMHETIVSVVKAHVEIFCNKDWEGNVQLKEVGVCFNRNHYVMNCKYNFSNCEDEIRFPAL